MFTRTFEPRQFLRAAFGTQPFLEYCQSRGLAFAQLEGMAMRDDDYRRWQEVLATASDADQARVELELAQVNELAHARAVGQLLGAAHGRELPADTVPGDTALALWFFLHHPLLFQDVLLRQEVDEVEGWRSARAPAGIVLADLHHRQVALAASLKDFFCVTEGTGRFCAIDAYALNSCYFFAAYLSDRLHLSEVFTDNGQHTMQALRLAFPLLFAYYPSDGSVLLKTRQRAADKIIDLFQRFGRAVLGVTLDKKCIAPVFRLDLLKRRFDPLPDAADMEMVRVKAMHLIYPERCGRRRLKLETLASDSQFAILELLERHGGDEQVLDELDVVYAELQVGLRVGNGSKQHVIRLWPDRCSLNQTALGERLRACLKRWGLHDAA